MKRSLTILAGTVLLFGAAACSNDSTPAPASSSTTVKATTTAAASSTTSAAPAPTTEAPQPAPVQPTQPAPQPTTAPPAPGPEHVAGAPCEGDGRWVHLDGGNAGHYGTEWLCDHTPVAPPAPDTTTPPAPNPDGARVEGAPCEGDGQWVHLEGGNAGHYGTDWLCRH